MTDELRHGTILNVLTVEALNVSNKRRRYDRNENLYSLIFTCACISYLLFINETLCIPFLLDFIDTDITFCHSMDTRLHFPYDINDRGPSFSTWPHRGFLFRHLWHRHSLSAWHPDIPDTWHGIPDTGHGWKNDQKRFPASQWVKMTRQKKSVNSKKILSSGQRSCRKRKDAPWDKSVQNDCCGK